ncbi:MMPL family transporter [Desulfovibrio inopinatus]|uniref:MMPL family transporter n=1 Tax=Desulfovibrio inopinatus TaxID=102109 RepID=UPI0012EBD5BD|nr:hypothetical protein [Desulfovibrio inopinatus]
MLAISILVVARTPLERDISIMLPQNEKNDVNDIDLLTIAPFAKKIFITLTRDETIPPARLTQAADALQQALPKTLFPNVLVGPPIDISPAMFQDIFVSFPLLFSAQDEAAISRLLTPEAIEHSLTEDKRILLSTPAGPIKRLISQDPLGLRRILLKKFRSAMPADFVDLRSGRFITDDRLHHLIVVDTVVPFTDPEASQHLLETVQRVIAQTLPAGISAMVTAGHRYTEANDNRIREDLSTVLPISGILLIGLAAFFLRSLSGLLVLLIPAGAFIFAVAGTVVFQGAISGIVVGFGAVILGITMDYGLHVYYALADAHGTDGAVLLSRLSRPLAMSCLTSLAAFIGLAFSDMPGIRQLAVFSMIGLATAFASSLGILPLLLPKRLSIRQHRISLHLPFSSHIPRTVVVAVFIVSLAASALAITHLETDGDLRNLGYIPQQLKLDEQRFHKIWGGARDMALIFSLGKTAEEALEHNEHIANRFHARFPDTEMVSLASILPSSQIMQANVTRWNQFWIKHNESVQKHLSTQAQVLGFSGTAFQPFVHMISTPAQVEEEEQFLQRLPGGLRDLFFKTGPTYTAAISLVPDTAEIADFFSNESTEGIRFLSLSQFRQSTARLMGETLVRFVGFTLVLVPIFVFLLFRNLTRTAAALFPVVAGLLAVLGYHAISAAPVTLYTIVAVPLILGLGVDYGIFMVSELDGAISPIARQAVIVSGLSTIIGLGTLAFCRHPALLGIGTTVLIGTLGGLVASLVILPALWRQA